MQMRPKLSTKCRQLETPKWELPKKFPFWRGWNVKGELPSPLHNPPMRVYALPHKFVYSLRGLLQNTEKTRKPWPWRRGGPRALPAGPCHMRKNVRRIRTICEITEHFLDSRLMLPGGASPSPASRDRLLRAFCNAPPLVFLFVFLRDRRRVIPQPPIWFMFRLAWLRWS